MDLPNYYEKTSAIYRYVLELQEGKYYVGISQNPEYRIYQHEYGHSTEFVRQYLPIIDYEVEVLETTDRDEALFEETNKAIELITIYGIENVCGGVILGNTKKREKTYKHELDKREISIFW